MKMKRELCTKQLKSCISLSVSQAKEIFHVEKLYESFIFKSKERADLHLTQVWISFTFQDSVLNRSVDYKVKKILEEN